MERADTQSGQMPTRRGFARGVVTTLPLLVALAPFGVVFGALAVDAGLTSIEAIGMSAAIVAGAAQLAALKLMADDAPAIVAILTGAVVNLRNAMYSASLAAHLQDARMRWRIPLAYFVFDQTYALTARRALDHPEESIADRMGFFFGIGLACVTTWMVSCVLGVYVGTQIPPEWSLDFLVPILFLSLAAPMIRGHAHIVAAAVAAGVALLAADLPYGLGLMVGAVAGIGAGMAISLHQEKDDG